ncbi:hypothetical protein B0H11DRAFT_2318957 [Mycena galericulata]|nr:hypothetical protein B0H11DRAFT_2318957 [Mycena galericulata]
MANTETSSLLSLPTEILATILVQNQNFSLLLNPWQLPRPPLPPEIILSHICRRCREVAISTPRLWTNVPTRVDRRLVPAELFGFYLQRSQPYPINVTFSTWLEVGELDAHSALLIQHLDRLREFRIHSISRPVMVASLLPFRDLCAPRLELLKISDDWHDRATGTVQTQYFDIFMAGPRHSRFQTLHIHLSWTHFYVPRSAVQSVTALNLSQAPSTRVAITDLRDLLTGLPNLTDLSVSNEILEGGNMEQQHISLPSVRAFSTFIAKGWAFPPVWPLLHMPNVERVALDAAHSNQIVSFFQNLRFRPRHPVLKSFSLSAPFCQGDSELTVVLPASVLQGLSSVTHLTLRNIYFPDTVLRRILATKVDSGVYPLPSLRSVDVYAPPGQSIGDIYDILLPRIVGGTAINLRIL